MSRKGSMFKFHISFQWRQARPGVKKKMRRRYDLEDDLKLFIGALRKNGAERHLTGHKFSCARLLEHFWC